LRWAGVLVASSVIVRWMPRPSFDASFTAGGGGKVADQPAPPAEASK